MSFFVSWQQSVHWRKGNLHVPAFFSQHTLFILDSKLKAIIWKLRWQWVYSLQIRCWTNRACTPLRSTDYPAYARSVASRMKWKNGRPHLIWSGRRNQIFQKQNVLVGIRTRDLCGWSFSVPLKPPSVGVIQKVQHSASNRNLDPKFHRTFYMQVQFFSRKLGTFFFVNGVMAFRFYWFQDEKHCCRDSNPRPTAL